MSIESNKILLVLEQTASVVSRQGEIYTPLEEFFRQKIILLLTKSENEGKMFVLIYELASTQSLHSLLLDH